MREREIERQFAAEVKKQGGIAVKFVSPGFDRMPDRLSLKSKDLAVLFFDIIREN